MLNPNIMGRSDYQYFFSGFTKQITLHVGIVAILDNRDFIFQMIFLLIRSFMLL